MIIKNIIGDIFDPKNQSDIVIAMNRTLDEPTALAARFTTKLKFNLKNPLPLGSVLSFNFDTERRLHMLICHEIGKGGWEKADKFIRFGMDYLDHNKEPDQKFSVVQIGTGPIGLRDGADLSAIMTAISTSFLPVTLYLREEAMVMTAGAKRAPLSLVAYAAWTPHHGYEEIPVAKYEMA